MSAAVTVAFWLSLVVGAGWVLKRWGDRALVGYSILVVLLIALAVGWGWLQGAVS